MSASGPFAQLRRWALFFPPTVTQRTRSLLWTSVAIALALATACNHCSPPPECKLPVTLLPQQQGLWCWAACGQMIMAFHRQDVSQCEQANFLFQHQDCCPPSVVITPGLALPDGCNQGGWPPFHHFGFDFNKTTDAALCWPQVQKQIYCQGRPFAFSWHEWGGGGHMVVAIGYSTVGGTNTVWFADPSTNPTADPSGGDGDFGVWPYEAYKDGPEQNSPHWDDYYNIRPRQP